MRDIILQKAAATDAVFFCLCLAPRLEGFVTSDAEQLNQDPFHYSATIPSPVPGMVIELKSGGGSRYTSTDPGGRFVFGGLHHEFSGCQARAQELNVENKS